MKRVSVSALVCVLLCACAATPPIAPRVDSIRPDRLGLSAEVAPAISDKWWTAFGDPQLNELVERALSDNPTLAAALARIQVAQSEISEARAATYPQISFDLQEQRERFSASYIIPPPYGGTWRWFGTVQGNLNWSLDLFGKQKTQIERLRAGADAAALDATGARLALAGAVTQAYIALARVYTLTEVAEQSVAQRQAIYDLTTTRLKNGLDNPAAQKVADALLASSKVELTRTMGARDLAVHQLAALTGHGADAYAIARPTLNMSALELPDALPADLLARRADVAAAQARIAAAAAGREIAHKAFYPDINLVGSFGWAAVGLNPLFGGSALQYGVGPAIHLPIFDAGQIRSRFEASTARLDEAVADYNQTLVAAVMQTADAISVLHTLQGQAGELRHFRAAAAESMTLEEERYKSGLSTQLNVLNAQDLVIRAARDDAALAADTTSARVTLIMALGGGFNATAQSLVQDASHE